MSSSSELVSLKECGGLDNASSIVSLGLRGRENTVRSMVLGVAFVAFVAFYVLKESVERGDEGEMVVV